jgi:cytochrome c oxidase cbb3-type subunit 3
MSSFFSWWIIILTLGNIAGAYWLIRWTMKRRPGESAEGTTTGHSWDGLEEYNNPLPRWWLWLFYITLVFGVIYLILYPGLGSFAGTFGWTQDKQYDEEVAKADAKYGPLFAKYAELGIPETAAQPEALQMGKRIFLNYCAQCHGSDARGAPGFPNLADGDWLYGGSPEAIQTTILNGRSGVMPALGPALGKEGLDEVVEYVLSLSGRSEDNAKAEKGKARFQTLCVACHGPDGKGNQALGAPNLTDETWLYGGSRGAIAKTIAQGRNGVMPAQKDFLGKDKAHLAAAYVWSLSN